MKKENSLMLGLITLIILGGLARRDYIPSEIWILCLYLIGFYCGRIYEFWMSTNFKLINSQSLTNIGEKKIRR